MPQAIKPWEPSNIPVEIQIELNRRKINRGLAYSDTDKFHDGSDAYKGPMAPWVRFCSNGAGKPENNPYEGSYGVYYDHRGFVLYGGKDFYKSYGFFTSETTLQANQSIIGYTPNGQIHFVDNDIRTSQHPIHVPPPEIERISVDLQHSLYRRATIEWVCFSSKQLEYMTPYFLSPGISCILEWGWNHFDPTSLLDLTNTTLLKNLRINPYPLYNNILTSRGNYDVTFGIVSSFEWAISGNKIKCKTEITSGDRIYAGMPTNLNIVTKTSDKIKDISIDPSLDSFVNSSLMAGIKSIPGFLKNDAITVKDGEFGVFVQYLKTEHRETWKEILLGTYFPRNFLNQNEVNPNTFSLFGPILVSTKDKNRGIPIEDWDRNRQDKVWINMGLLIEILNYHSKLLTLFRGKPMFKIDINDCIIGAHPNLISTDGDVMLIPNSRAPKYFAGLYGAIVHSDSEADEARSYEYENIINFSSHPPNTSVAESLTKEDILKNNMSADYTLASICKQLFSGGRRGSLRDDIDEIINKLRYDTLNTGNEAIKHRFAFPSNSGGKSNSEYPDGMTGHLKHIYFDVAKFGEVVRSSSTVTQVISKILKLISGAAGNFWDLRLSGGTGSDNDSKDQKACMKIIDYNNIASMNDVGKVYTFDWMDSDSLLQNIKFTPTISDAQTSRTMFAVTNNSNTTVSDDNNMLDFQAKDRLYLDESTPESSNTSQKDKSSFIKFMREIQALKPDKDAYQVTETYKARPLIRRLAIPPFARELLTLLLNDGDVEHNPRYLRIQPNIQAQFTLQGIGGLRTMMYFLVKNLPKPYSHEDVVFRIINMSEMVESGKWTTEITAGVMPLGRSIKLKLGIT